MVLERALLAAGAALLLLLARLDTLERDGDEGLKAMRVIAAVLLLTAVCLKPLKAVWTAPLGKLLLIPQLAVVVYLAAVLAVFCFGLVCRADGGERFLLVLGTSLRGDAPSRLLQGRLEAAKEYLEQNPQTAAVLTGGQVRDEILPEGEAMRRWMVSGGVPAGRLAVERESATTYQNFTRSLPILRESGFQPWEPLAVATDRFHFARCVWLARKAGYRRLRLVPSKNSSLRMAGWYFREVLVFLKLKIEGPS